MNKDRVANRFRKIFYRFFVDFFASGLTDIHDVEIIRKVNILNAIGVIGIGALLPLGLDALRLGNPIVGSFDLCVSIILFSGIIYLRSGKNFSFIINLSLTSAALLFLTLLILQWEEGAGYLWYFVFPLISSFLKGSRKGLIVSILLIAITAVIFMFSNFLGLKFDRTAGFHIRFIAAYLVVTILAYSFEKTREKTQSRVIAQNRRLQIRLEELNNLKDRIRDSNRLLEERIKERTSALIAANSILDNEIREKEVLLNEIHHRVKNNLQVISSLLYLQSSEIQDEKTANYFLDSRNRVLSMAMVHDVLYQSENLASVSLSQYIESLVSELLFSIVRSDLKIKVDLQIEDIAVTIEKATPVGLIVNEIVSNSLKHAFLQNNGIISIYISKDPENIVTMIIADNGIGSSDEIDLKNAKTLGLSLVESLIEQIGGSCTVQNLPGTKYNIKFKV